MKILAINGSPRGTGSNTDRILQPFLEGSLEAGAETETVYLKEKRINYCVGCFTCWTRTPGVCIHKDDMPDLLEKIREADILVYASPLYIFTVTAQMKTFLDRCIPLLQPYIVKRGDQYIHPTRYENNYPKKAVLISNCGFPERHHFTGMVETFRRLTASPDTELAATILCAGGELLKQSALQEQLRWYIDAARLAGREVTEKGRILPETQAALDRPLADPEFYSQMANAYWDSVIPRVPKVGRASTEKETGTPLSPPRSRDTVRDMIAGMAMVFNPQAAAGGSGQSEQPLEAVIQFRVTGNEPGEYYLRIAEEKCAAFEGVHPQPTLTIHTPSEVWLAISRRELSGTEGFIKKKYRIEGDMGLLMRFEQLFPSGDGPAAEPPTVPEYFQAPSLEETVQRGPLKLGMHWLTLAFVPWIANAIMIDIRGLSLWVSIGIPLLLGLLLWGYRRAFGRPTWMETGGPIYFAVAGLVTLFGSDFFRTYNVVVGNLVLSGIWMSTLATATPLTFEYSKWSYPPALWPTFAFVRTNAVLTAFWGVMFLLMSVTALIGCFAPAHQGLWVIIRNLLLIPGFAFTSWFQKWYPVRLEKAK
ncbi:MAG: NAD(P)H-dependent oxidoreductase [Candidatus Lindowbacteria bacterium]|nr:NAD(P)H-dependent oxidoreductase [Candidatus Lindowbacteria bacterium]